MDGESGTRMQKVVGKSGCPQSNRGGKIVVCILLNVNRMRLVKPPWQTAGSEIALEKKAGLFLAKRAAALSKLARSGIKVTNRFTP